MNILVTGASGFLGSRLLTELNKTYNSIYGVSSRDTKTSIGCNLTDKDSVKELINGVEPDYIIHCAAMVPKKMSDYNDDILSKSNVLMTQNIVSTSSCPIIYLSSMTVYGNYKNGTVSENHTCNPLNRYAESKLYCEHLIKESGTEGFAIRIPGLFGLPRKSGLVYNLISSAITGDEIALPEAPISWAGMHVQDAAQGIISLLPEAHNSFLEVNLGCKGSASVNKLINIINDLFGSKIQTNLNYPVFEFDLSRYKSLTSLSSSSLKNNIQKFGDEIDI